MPAQSLERDRCRKSFEELGRACCVSPIQSYLMFRCMVFLIQLHEAPVLVSLFHCFMGISARAEGRVLGYLAVTIFTPFFSWILGLTDLRCKKRALNIEESSIVKKCWTRATQHSARFCSDLNKIFQLESFVVVRRSDKRCFGKVTDQIVLRKLHTTNSTKSV